MGKGKGILTNNKTKMVIEKHLTCLLREGFCQDMCKPSLIFNWYFVVAVSKIEKQSSGH